MLVVQGRCVPLERAECSNGFEGKLAFKTLGVVRSCL